MYSSASKNTGVRRRTRPGVRKTRRIGAGKYNCPSPRNAEETDIDVGHRFWGIGKRKQKTQLTDSFWKYQNRLV